MKYDIFPDLEGLMLFSFLMGLWGGGQRKPLTAKVIFFLNYLHCLHRFLKNQILYFHCSLQTF